MRKLPFLLGAALAAFSIPATEAADPAQFSGIYPHLAMFNDEGECGTGAVVPWADRLWAITYGPHMPFGSSDKLYEITPDLRQIVRPESVGGTPANRLIHRESNQLAIGPYWIDAQRQVRVIPPKAMPGRLTGNARHLTDPANKIYYATMEEALYEVDVRTLEVTGLIKDSNVPKPGQTDEKHPATVKSELPGYHGKGLYTGQGRVLYANNGEYGKAALTDPTTPSGALGEWRGSGAWQLIRRNQFTEITGPGGIYGSEENDPLWSIGWDARSLILMCLDGGTWHAYRLPKGSHSYDGAHGWNTEWPRIRDIGENDLLMTMHGTFWKFPKTFCAKHSGGITPRSNYLKVIGDFCRWQDQLVFGCDDSAKSEFLNKRKAKGNLAGPGQSQSNLWFVKPAQLDQLGPVIGRGAVWLDDAVKAGVPSDPYLFSGYERRGVHLAHRAAQPVVFTFEVDRNGNDQWQTLREVTVPASGYTWVDFPANETGAWVRVKTNADCAQATAFFQFSNEDRRTAKTADLFASIAKPEDHEVNGGLLSVRGANLRTLRFATDGGLYDLDAESKLHRVEDPQGAEWLRANFAIPRDVVAADAASMLYTDEQGHRWRFPRGAANFEPAAEERVCREVCTERDLFNCAGTFFELPAENAGGFAKIRPITTHLRRIKDYASYRGLLVLAGLRAGAENDPHVVRSDDGKTALWLGAVDDLWQFGKPRGLGGPWQETEVQAGTPSDAYLMTGYDRKHLRLSHAAKAPVTVRVEVDFAGTGKWAPYREFSVPAGQTIEHDFPAAFSAYWVRVVADQATRATAQFSYE